MKKFCVSMLMVTAMAATLLAQAPNFAAPAGSPVARHGALRVQGNKIVGSHGRPVQLRGMSFFWNTTGWGGLNFYTPGVVNTLIDDWKVDVLRVAIDPQETGNNNWRTVVNAAVAKGVYVIIDYHAHSHTLANGAQTFFTGLLNDYGNRPHVIYEIFNEPCSNSPSTNGGGGCTGDDWDGASGQTHGGGNHIRPYAQQVVNAVRGTNGTRDTNIIIIGTPNFSKRVDIAARNPVVGRNLAYAAHFYTGHVPTPTDPNGTTSEHRHRLRVWIQTALDAGLAVFVSEFGVSQPGGGLANGENNSIDTLEGAEWFRFLDRHSIGWANWSVNDKNEAASALRPGASTSGGWTAGSTNCSAANGTGNSSSCGQHGNLSCSGSFIRNRLRYYATPISFSATHEGPGTVSVLPQSTQYFPTESVTLTATPTAGNRFEGWMGAGLTGNAVVALTTELSISAATSSVRGVFVQDNVLVNSTFTHPDIAPWAGVNTGAANPTLTRTDAGELRVGMPSNTGSAPNAVRVEQGRLSVTQGREYTLTFRARAASGTRTITPAFRGNNALGTFVVGESVVLTPTMQTFTARFTAAATVSGANGAVLAFYCGGTAGDWFLDDVVLLGGNVSSILPQTAAAKPFKASFNGHALALSGGGKVVDITVYDVSGRVRMSQKVSLSNAGTQVSLSRLPAGVYTVRYKVDGKAMGTNEKIVLAK